MDPRNRPAPYVPTFLPEKSKFSETILPILSSILTELCKANDRCQTDPKITKFHALAVPPISVATYLQRIAQYSDASDTCYILALVYLDRIQARPEFLVTSLNIHRLLITSVMVAAKFFDDTYYNNAYYARVGGIAKQEMNALELEFLFMIGFSLSVSSAEFQQYDNELRAHYARRQAPTLSRPIANSCVFPQQQQQQTPQIQSSHVHIQQQQQQQPPSAGRNYASAPISYGVPVQQHPVYAPSRNFSYPSHPHQFSDSNVELSFYSNNNAMEVEAAERPISIPQPSNAIVIRGPQNSRQQQVHSTPTCSPPSSDFVESVTSSRWVMIQ